MLLQNKNMIKNVINIIQKLLGINDKEQIINILLNKNNIVKDSINTVNKDDIIYSKFDKNQSLTKLEFFFKYVVSSTD